MKNDKQFVKDITNIDENFPQWYTDIVLKAELADYTDVKGFIAIRPYGYAIWENIKDILDKKIKEKGVQNACFPALIPVELMEREAEHVSGFAKECVVITHHRLIEKDGELIPDGKLEKPYILRPTSETIIGESFSKWIKSYRDLPFKINQWANVFRWEMRPRIFLRTSEFFWQEGHCVFTTQKDADDNARQMLDVYNDIFENYLAIHGICGQKTEDEKFAGAEKTYTIESMMQDGKALQSCTSHNLGQNFAMASNIKFTNENQQEQYAWTSSWGLSTRSIGALIMSHSDDDGLVLPPKIAPYQVVIIPVIHNEDKKDLVMNYCNKIKDSLNCRVLIDDTYDTPQNKKWNWVRKGAPLRLEIGERDLENNSIFFARRDKIMEKNSLSFDEFIKNYQNILDNIQETLLERTKENLKQKTIKIETIEELDKLAEKKVKFFNLPYKFFGNKDLEKVMEKYSLSFRCIPFDESDRVIIAKSY